MARNGGIREAALGLARERAVTLVADSATLTDANINPEDAISCRGFETVWVGVEVDGTTNSEATIEPLIYDPDAADGTRWKRLYVGAPNGVTPASAAAQKTPSIPEGQMHELRVFGQLKVFFRIDAVVNPGVSTGFRVLIMGGKRL